MFCAGRCSVGELSRRILVIDCWSVELVNVASRPNQGPRSGQMEHDKSGNQNPVGGAHSGTAADPGMNSI